MSWNTPYIVIRLGDDESVEVVHSAASLKDARYWLQYIAMPGDAIFLTPAHDRHKGDGPPEYKAHLISRGKIDYNEDRWKDQIELESPVAFEE